jgi:hypothetical protein
MSHRIALLLLPLALAAATAEAQTAKKLYCWDDKGTRVCSDTLPPTDLDKARTEVSAKSGRTLREVGRALTPEERAAQQAAQQQAAQQQAAQQAAQRRDLAMVEAYDSEADLRRAFGERSTLVDEAIKGSALAIANLRLSLVSLLNQAGDRELAGQPVAGGIATQIREQHADLEKQQQLYAEQRTQRAELDAELDDALSRYRALKNGSAPAAAAPAAGSPPAATP